MFAETLGDLVGVLNKELTLLTKAKTELEDVLANVVIQQPYLAKVELLLTNITAEINAIPDVLAFAVSRAELAQQSIQVAESAQRELCRGAIAFAPVTKRKNGAKVPLERRDYENLIMGRPIEEN